jgi:hypothetical protein
LIARNKRNRSYLIFSVQCRISWIMSRPLGSVWCLLFIRWVNPDLKYQVASSLERKKSLKFPFRLTLENSFQIFKQRPILVAERLVDVRSIFKRFVFLLPYRAFAVRSQWVHERIERIMDFGQTGWNTLSFNFGLVTSFHFKIRMPHNTGWM